MATDYVVPAYRVNQMRRAARQFRVAAIGAIRAHDGNDQSCIAPYDANGLLPVYLHLRMRAGYRLGAYQFGGRGDAFCVPLYASLLFLTWGICLKQITLLLFLISIISTLFLFLTAIFDEKECLKYFGEKYKTYMKRSKRFVPFIF